MLTRLRLTNFKAHRDLSVDLSPITVLVGPNGCGKSTVLEALYCLSRVAERGDVHAGFSGERAPEELRRAGSNEAVSLTLLGHSADGRPFRCDWRYEGKGRGSFGLDWVDHGKGDAGPVVGHSEDRALVGELSAAQWRRFEPRHLARPVPVMEVAPSLADDGEGLAEVLSYLKLREQDAYEAIVAALVQIVPSVKGLRFDRVKVRVPRARERSPFRDFSLPGMAVGAAASDEVEHIANRLLFDTVHGDGIPAHRASEGTLLILGLLTTIFHPSSSKLLLLEEPERALHPRAFMEFVPHLRKVLAARPDVQIVMASHSPYLVSCFEAEEVHLLGTEADGTSSCVRLDRHPEFDRWQDVMTPGEMWFMLDTRGGSVG